MGDSGNRTDDEESTIPGFSLTVASAEDWKEVCRLRHDALDQAPNVFLSRQDERAWREAEWRAAISAATWVIARLDGEAVGIARSTAEPAEAHRRHIEAVWVGSEHRRRRIASMLVRRLVDLIEAERDTEPTEILIWIIDSNDAARALYEKLGFEPTGETQPIAGGEERIEERLWLPPHARVRVV